MKALLIIIFVSQHLALPPTVSSQPFETMEQCIQARQQIKQVLDKEHSIDSRLTETIRCVRL
jgi:hypothetical protein